MADKLEDQALAKMMETISNPALQACIRAVQGVVGYELDEVERAPFLRFPRYVSHEPEPEYIACWRTSPNLEHWYHRHVNGVLGDTQNALSAVCYHRDRLVDLERRVREVLATCDYRSMLGNDP